MQKDNREPSHGIFLGATPAVHPLLWGRELFQVVRAQNLSFCTLTSNYDPPRSYGLLVCWTLIYLYVSCLFFSPSSFHRVYKSHFPSPFSLNLLCCPGSCVNELKKTSLEGGSRATMGNGDSQPSPPTGPPPGTGGMIQSALMLKQNSSHLQLLAKHMCHLPTMWQENLFLVVRHKKVQESNITI